MKWQFHRPTLQEGYWVKVDQNIEMNEERGVTERGKEEKKAG